MADISYGTTYPFNEAVTYNVSVAFLDDTHFVVVYRDTSNSSYGTAIIGIISDADVITFGSEYVFNASSTSFINVTAIDSTHFVIVYQDYGDNSYGKAVIGTVSSGDEIAYGNIYPFLEADTYDIAVDILDTTHFVVVYKDLLVDNDGQAKIGVISDTDVITFGSQYTYNSAAVAYVSVAALDSTHFVVSYKDNGGDNDAHCKIGIVSSGDQIAYGSEYKYTTATIYNSNVAKIDSTHFIVAYATATAGSSKIGTVSGTPVDDIAYGSEYTFLGDNYINYISISLLDSTHFVVSYQNEGGDTNGYSAIGTIASVNQISYGDAVVYNSARTEYVSSCPIDSTHFAVAYKDDGGADYGEAVIGTYAVPVTTDIKSFNSLAYASMKSIMGLGIEDVKSVNGLA